MYNQSHTLTVKGEGEPGSFLFFLSFGETLIFGEEKESQRGKEGNERGDSFWSRNSRATSNTRHHTRTNRIHLPHQNQAPLIHHHHHPLTAWLNSFETALYTLSHRYSTILTKSAPIRLELNHLNLPLRELCIFGAAIKSAYRLAKANLRQPDNQIVRSYSF